jgi:hypothetical protein
MALVILILSQRCLRMTQQAGYARQNSGKNAFLRLARRLLYHFFRDRGSLESWQSRGSPFSVVFPESRLGPPTGRPNGPKQIWPYGCRLGIIRFT